MIYRELNINEKINIKSWIAHDMPFVNGGVFYWVEFYKSKLPISLIRRKDTLCNRESLLFRMNWHINRINEK